MARWLAGWHRSRGASTGRVARNDLPRAADRRCRCSCRLDRAPASGPANRGFRASGSVSGKTSGAIPAPWPGAARHGRIRGSRSTTRRQRPKASRDDAAIAACRPGHRTPHRCARWFRALARDQARHAQLARQARRSTPLACGLPASAPLLPPRGNDAHDRPAARCWPLISRVRQATDTARIGRRS